MRICLALVTVALAFTAFPKPVFGSSQDLEATNPVVVETTPTLNQCGVPPDLKFIEVRFDQPMRQSSWSWCGGGSHYPEISGKPFFRDEYTAVLPVSLEPQKVYFMGVNCPSAQNFVSDRGVAGEPFSLSFVTAAGSQIRPARMDNYKSWEELTKQFTEVYSYYDRTGTDWKKAFAEVRPCILESPTVEEFVLRTVAVLRFADDPHLALRMPDGSRVGTHKHFGFYNANDAVIAKEFPALRKDNDLVWSAHRGKVGYLAIRGWDNHSKLMDVIQFILAEMKNSATCLIVDVRANGGGDETEARRVASWFLDESHMYAKHRFRDKNAPDGWSPMGERWIRANAPERRYPYPVILLQGSCCLSSNEAFLEMMNQSPRVTSLGATSGGSSANPKSFDLPNGAKIIIPQWQSYSADGVMLEGRGIAPDIAMTGDFENDDPVLKEALLMAEDIVTTTTLTFSDPGKNPL